MANLKFEKIRSFDWVLFFTAIFIALCGLTVVYSAGYSHELKASPPFMKQLAAFGVGFFLFFVGSFISTEKWSSLAIPVYVCCFLLLIAVELVGVSAGGAKRWLAFGPVRLQPSEFMKLGVILMLARYLSVRKYQLLSFKDLIIPLLIIGVPAALIKEQPDLGTGLIVGLIGVSILFSYGIEKKVYVVSSFLGAMLSYPIWHSLKDYQKLRIINFIWPDSDPLKTGYHALQSKIAVGSGSMFGKGMMEGTQTQLRFLPEQTTDFIFSVLAEEWGFVGSTVVISLYLFLIIKLFRNTQKNKDQFRVLLGVGVTALFFWHTFMNIGMVIGILPVVGVTLKLFSYGGSSVTSGLLSLGIASGLRAKKN